MSEMRFSLVRPSELPHADDDWSSDVPAIAASVRRSGPTARRNGVTQQGDTVRVSMITLCAAGWTLLPHKGIGFAHTTGNSSPTCWEVPLPSLWNATRGRTEGDV